jgi:hypothetical protein
MSYVTVFEITHEAIPLWFPVAFLLFGVVAAILLLDSRGLGFPLVFLLALLWGVPAAYTFHARTHERQLYRNGKYKVVEGPVEHYSLEAKHECFSVRGVEFCHGTANQVGWVPPLRLGPSTWPVGLFSTSEGLPVRVAYYDDGQYHVLLRLDIGRNSR